MQSPRQPRPRPLIADVLLASVANADMDRRVHLNTGLRRSWHRPALSARERSGLRAFQRMAPKDRAARHRSSAWGTSLASEQARRELGTQDGRDSAGWARALAGITLVKTFNRW